MVSAGMINPAVLKRFTTFWLAQEQIDSLKNTMTEIKTIYRSKLLDRKTYSKSFHDEKKKELWLKKSDDESF